MQTNIDLLLSWTFKLFSHFWVLISNIFSSELILNWTEHMLLSDVAHIC